MGVGSSFGKDVVNEGGGGGGRGGYPRVPPWTHLKSMPREISAPKVSVKLVLHRSVNVLLYSSSVTTKVSICCSFFFVSQYSSFMRFVTSPASVS